MKYFYLDCKIEDIPNLEELEKSGIFVRDNGPNLKVFYPFDMEQPEILKPKQYVKSGDEGCGAPGTIEWYTTCINQMFAPKEVAVYVKKSIGVDIKADRIDYTKKRAIKAIEGYLNGNS